MFILRLIQKILGPFLFFLFIRSIFTDFTRAQQRGGAKRDWSGGAGSGGAQGGGSRNYGYGGQSSQSSGGFNFKPQPSAYDVLGLPRNATNEEIRSKYRELISKYHPDKFAGLNDPEFTKLAAKKFQEIQGAYEELKRLRGI